jgi:predicted protein tyrosine phosphatase
MTRLLIAPYSALAETVRRHRPSHVLSLLVDPVVATPAGIAPERHLRIAVHDIAAPAPGEIAPAAGHIDTILAFGRGWDRSAPILVHCWAGISRSTAAAYILLCDLHGPGHEDEIARALRFHAAHAYPNRLMIHHADRILARGGRMIAAVDTMGAGSGVSEGTVVDMPLALDAL